MAVAINWLWHGTVVAVATALVLAARPRARARHRHALCLSSLALVVALPLISPLTAHSRRTLVSEAPGPLPALTLPNHWAVGAWWLGLWSVLMAAASVSAVRSIRTVRRIRRQATPVPGRIEDSLPHWQRLRSAGRRCRLGTSGVVSSAAMVGGSPPLIALAPALVTTLDAETLDHIVAHEWAHVQRRDDLVGAAVLAVRVAAGWHPAIWWLSRQLQIERERACDEIVVAVTGRPKAYASSLAAVAALAPAGRLLNVPGALSGSTLAARVVSILSWPTRMSPARSALWAGASAAGLLVLAAAVSGLPLVTARTGLPRQAAAAIGPARSAAASLPVAAPVETRRHASSTSHDADRSTAAHAIESPAGKPRAGLSLDAAPPPLIEATSSAAIVLQPPAADRAAAGGAIDRSALRARDGSGSSGPVRAADDAGSLWRAASAGGVGLGRTSQQAAVATAGAFARFGRKLASSFKE
jgi:beta-lactamase regulating signal transducer with metallopeptidase domain